MVYFYSAVARRSRGVIRSIFAPALTVYTVNSLHLVQNLPNAKLILYPDSNHGSWYQNHEDFIFEVNRFLG